MLLFADARYSDVISAVARDLAEQGGASSGGTFLSRSTARLLAELDRDHPDVGIASLVATNGDDLARSRVAKSLFDVGGDPSRVVTSTDAGLDRVDVTPPDEAPFGAAGAQTTAADLALPAEAEAASEVLDEARRLRLESAAGLGGDDTEPPLVRPDDPGELGVGRSTSSADEALDGPGGRADLRDDPDDPGWAPDGPSRL